MKDEVLLRNVFDAGIFRGDMFFDEPMDKHTTMKIGGMADIFARPRDIVSLKNLLLEAKDKSIPLTPIGGGSNILVSDDGIEGMVISLAYLNRIAVISDTGDAVRLFAEAGTPLQKVVNFCRDKGYKGLEGLTGIPGHIGGAIRGNAGSFGYEIGSVIESIAFMDEGSNISIIKAEDMVFGYRSNIMPEEGLILSANISLKKDDRFAVAERMNFFIREKSFKQPVSEHSAGCVFKNPAGLSAGRLIEDSHCKGMKRGDIEVSSLHANFFINMGRGTAMDFLALMDEVRSRVRKTFDVSLEPEIRIIGRNSVN